MSKEYITCKEKVILDEIKKSVLEKGYPPTVRELCNAVGLRSTSSVFEHLKNLEKKGYIHRDPTKPRAIEVYDEEFNNIVYEESFKNVSQNSFKMIPVITNIDSMSSICDDKNISDFFPIPTSIIPKNFTFLCSVNDNDMSDEGIFKDDKVLVEINNNIKNEDIVLILKSKKTYVRHYLNKDNKIYSYINNDKLNPIERKNIIGTVIGVYKFIED